MQDHSYLYQTPLPMFFHLVLLIQMLYTNQVLTVDTSPHEQQFYAAHRAPDT